MNGVASFEQLAMLAGGGLALPLSPALLANLSLLTSQNGALRMPSLGIQPNAGLSGGQQQQQAFFGAHAAKQAEAHSFASDAAMLDPSGLLAASLLAGGPAAAPSVDTASLEHHWLHRPQKQL